MRDIPHWNTRETIRVAESAGGVLVVVNPRENLVLSSSAWLAPDLLQKLYASGRFRGASAEDDREAKRTLGYYCDLQSLNSEDAVTWSFFGNLSHSSATERKAVFNAMLAQIGQAADPEPPTCWLWRRLPHPEKPESSGGPEIDFGFLTGSTLLLGEAKWNSKLGVGQGIKGNRTQLFLRTHYCDTLAKKALPEVRRCLVLGIGRSANVFDGADPGIGSSATVAQLSWREVAQCFVGELAYDLKKYLAWKEQHSSAA